MTSDWRQGLPNGEGIDVLWDEPMAQHTTYKVGGSARAFIKLSNVESLSATPDYVSSKHIPFLVIGNGSNVLFSDADFEGAVLQLAKGFDQIALREGTLKDAPVLSVGASLSVTKLIRFMKRQKISGVEYLGGVPGTVGGAVRMNAGTVMGEVSDTLLRARVIVAGQEPRWLTTSELNLSYRHSDLPANAIVLEAEFACRVADSETFERLDEVLRYRKKTQPLQMPSCGSVFANPPGDHAGRLIEACGLKGETVGGAQISEKHANWIVNLGQAKATDISEVGVGSLDDAHPSSMAREVSEGRLRPRCRRQSDGRSRDS
mgnify:CR=1 FL=1